MVPQESLVKAIGTALLALKDSDPETAGQTLLKGISGRLSLPGQVVENLAGYGYDEKGRWHTGDLPLGPLGVLQKAFSPPIGSQLLDDPSGIYLTAQTLGVSAFPESTSSIKDRTSQIRFGKSYDELMPKDRNVIDNLPAVVNSKSARRAERLPGREGPPRGAYRHGAEAVRRDLRQRRERPQAVGRLARHRPQAAADGHRP